jgi:hypothetical protein
VMENIGDDHDIECAYGDYSEDIGFFIVDRHHYYKRGRQTASDLLKVKREPGH